MQRRGMAPRRLRRDGPLSAILRSMAETECLLARVARADGDLVSARSLAERALNQFRVEGDLEGTAAAARTRPGVPG